MPRKLDAQDTTDHPRFSPRRGGRLTAGLIGFGCGVLTWHAVGFWGFVTSVVHGMPPSETSGAAILAKTSDPKGWDRLAAAGIQSTADGGKRCVALAMSENRAGATETRCKPAIEAGLKAVPGIAPRNARLATSQQLQATVGRSNAAPVAGWAARLAEDKPAEGTRAWDDETTVSAAD